MVKKLNSNHIKIIALVAMTIDHITQLLFPGFSYKFLPIFLHMIGRLAFPIYAFCVAEGYHYTRNINKYLERLLILALISHIPFIMEVDSFTKYGWKAFIPFLTANAFPADWTSIGPIIVFIIASNRGDPKKQILWSGLIILMFVILFVILVDMVYGLLQLSTLLSIPILRMYNGKKSSNEKVNKKNNNIKIKIEIEIEILRIYQ
ncbi:TraX protein-domain-containing protein [Neocallimastix lanati (nom. inval.)]|uniref:Uncharacterized protein n=1 Tax=Neocallimastix californiae TaxID=1754190 RepID=A0A1Y2D4A9_9FUNG|nr:TraX protein-domain-containing protein [Neocallimastix sp. JGI-2020a]ORY54047.1 hypothetical protein LY90DRAFT_507925 [Neocallimastix californiae]|eukprot:ORY54047.1 hypothetical protein LY90DRAFT_507925 [Neocallimastix californiae]